jgi:hypothetical protein
MRLGSPSLKTQRRDGEVKSFRGSAKFLDMEFRMVTPKHEAQKVLAAMQIIISAEVTS